MSQFFKFAFVGVVNTAVDFIILNLLTVFFGIGAQGQRYVLFKAISFIGAVINSYVFNKYWVFKKNDAPEAKEPVLFVLVSVVGLFLNVSISNGVFQSIMDVGGVSSGLAVNIGALTGTCFVFVWNFLGYKFLVFKNNNDYA